MGGLLVKEHLVGVFRQAAGDEPIANTHGGVLVVPGHDPHPTVPGLEGFPVRVGQHEPHPVLNHDVFDLGVVPQFVEQRPPNAPKGIRGVGVLGHLGHDRGRIRGDDRIHTCERVFDRGVEHGVERGSEHHGTGHEGGTQHDRDNTKQQTKLVRHDGADAQFQHGGTPAGGFDFLGRLTPFDGFFPFVLVVPLVFFVPCLVGVVYIVRIGVVVIVRVRRVRVIYIVGLIFNIVRLA